MSVVVSVNVGLPQDVAWQGRTVRTAAWKTPVAGRIFACAVRLACSKIFRMAWQSGAFPGLGFTSGARPRSRLSGAAATAPHRPDGPAGDGPVVTFLRNGLAVAWDPRFGSLLELAEACAVPVGWSCRSGVCHNCESGLIEGEPAYAPKPSDPPEEGNALICCATPRTAVELDL